MDTDRKPEALEARVRESEENAAEKNVRQSENRDRIIPRMQCGEDDSDEDDRESAMPSIKLLKPVPAKEQLFMDDRGDEGREQFDPRKSGAALMT